MANSQESFGQIIRTFRKKRKMTQKMLAEDICFTKCFEPDRK